MKLVRPNVWLGRNGRWYVDAGKIAGKRRLTSRKTKQEAEDLRTQWIAEITKMGESAFNLSPTQRLDAQAAYTLIEKAGLMPRFNLQDAVSYYIDIHKGSVSAPTLQQALTERLDSMCTQNCRQVSIDSAATRLGRFCEDMNYGGARLVSEVYRDTITTWLKVKGWPSSVTRKNYILELSAFFEFCIKKGWIKENPCKNIEKPRLSYKVPEFLSVDQVTAIMREAVKSDPCMVPKLALGFFAGIRPEELKRIEWTDINTENRLVTVRAEVAKCGVPRHVTMSDNLMEWLNRGDTGFKLDSFDERRQAICKAVGVYHWPHDAMRHTFATYHLAMYQDAGRTSFELGHSKDSKLLYRHYAGLTTKTEAESYWKISP